MTQNVLQWNRKYRVYTLPDESVVLSSTDDQFWLSRQHFPLFNLIDGEKSQDEIAGASTNLLDGSTFLYRVDYLKENSDCFTDSGDQYRQSLPVEVLSQSRLAESVIKLSSSSDSALLLLLEQCASRLEGDNTARLIWVDDFLDKGLVEVVQRIDSPCAFICQTERTVNVSPVFSAGSANRFVSFQSRLLANKPVLRMLANLFPEQSHCPPIKDTDFSSVSEYSQQKLSDSICQSLQSAEDALIEISFTGGVTHHAFNNALEVSPEAFTEQVLQPIELKSCSVEFNKDGGSRHICPSETVAKLKPLIDPVTGVISTLEELASEGDYPVKIYRTAFYKALPPKDIAKIAEDSFVQTCLGKGVTHEQSRASALCEAIERYSAQYQGSEPLLLKTPQALGKRYYDFQSLVPYSAAQFDCFTDANHPDSQLKQAAQPYNGEAIHWLPTWSLTEEEQVYVPLVSCFANTPFEEDRFGRWHSNGAAAGNTLEEAILQALFELIERDATAIWWYNRIPRPGFDLGRIDPEYYGPLHESLADKHDYWVLDLTHDMGVPVMAAIGRHKGTGGYIFGFGCHLQPELAAQRALTELCQLIPIRNQNGAPFDFDAIVGGPHLNPAADVQPEAYLFEPSGDIKQDILAIVYKLKALGFETLVLNYSREPLPIKTAKVFIPGLCHIWPQLANERLYHLPVTLSWLTEANTEENINPQALYI
ncbi:YcaO-like family protein [Oceanospirillum beijerinckii]|uniref:YcaO-like family protein n=1 Tax=Oceanospirillum beijerinckii TaxID=64976 RepID=UPI00040C9001|nr:YcaO-like family protein [Oceanospirillum beijerinckii]